MKKNDICTGVVTAYGSEGEGIIKNGEHTIFLPFAIPGEKVRFRVLKVQKNIAFAKVEEILTPADGRVRVKCPVFTKCGGCQLMHINYNAQLVLKHDIIADCFKKIGFISINPSKTVASHNQLNYRNKLQLPIRMTNDGPELGFFAMNSHRIVPIDQCYIHGEWCKVIIESVKKYMLKKNIMPYDEVTGSGTLRHVVVKKAGNQFLIILVANSRTVNDIGYLERLLKDGLNSEFSLFVNINTRRDNVILSNDFIKISGSGYITDKFMDIKYSIGPSSFMQVNDYIKGRLYQKVAELVPKDSDVIDAYCGAGLLTAILSKKCNNAIGVEIVPEAIQCANKMANENNIKNIKFITGDCGIVLPDIVKENPGATVVLDPPRKGIAKSVAEAILQCRPKHIIYVSCSPQTLARDIGIISGTLKYEGDNLKKNIDTPIVADNETILPTGYKIEYLCGYDMFCQCKGVETICSLVRDD